MTRVRRDDIARVERNGREIEGVVIEVREEPSGHDRVVIDPFGDGWPFDTAAERVEVAR